LLSLSSTVGWTDLNLDHLRIQQEDNQENDNDTNGEDESDASTSDSSSPKDSDLPQNDAGLSPTPDTLQESPESNNTPPILPRVPSAINTIPPTIGTAPPTAIPPTIRTAPPTDAKLPSEQLSKHSATALQYKDSSDQVMLSWELRFIWIILSLFILALALQLLHFIFPFSVFSFLSKSSHGLIIVGTFLLILGIAYKFFYMGQIFGNFLYFNLLWFSVTTAVMYILARCRYPKVYITSIPVSIIIIGALVWSLSGRIMPPDTKASGYFYTLWWQLGEFATYTAFGILALAGAWLVTSGFLGFLARRNYSFRFGLHPKEWIEYRLQPGSLVILAYPLLTIAMISNMLWSQFTLGSAQQIWFNFTRLWSIPICWLLLTAYLLSLRLTQPDTISDELLDNELGDDEWDHLLIPKSKNKISGLFLFLATVGTALIFVYTPMIVALLGR
jgi:hypothetical protein